MSRVCGAVVSLGQRRDATYDELRRAIRYHVYPTPEQERVLSERELQLRQWIAEEDEREREAALSEALIELFRVAGEAGMRREQIIDLVYGQVAIRYPDLTREVVEMVIGGLCAEPEKGK
jgi:hypothetical protein